MEIVVLNQSRWLFSNKWWFDYIYVDLQIDVNSNKSYNR